MTRLLSPHNNIYLYKFIYLKKFLYIIFLLSLSNNPRKYLYKKKKIYSYSFMFIYLYNINIHKTLGYQKNFSRNLQFISYIYII